MDRSKDQDKSRTERIAEFFALLEHAPENTPRAPVPAEPPLFPDPSEQPSNAELIFGAAQQRQEESPLKRAAVLHGHLLEGRASSLTGGEAPRTGTVIRREERRERKNSLSGVFQRFFGDSGLRRRSRGVSVSEQLQLSEVSGWHISENQHRLFVLARTVVTCAVVAVGTFAIAKSAPLQRLATLLGDNHSTAYAYSPEQLLPVHAVFKPKFGPDAVVQCIDSCTQMQEMSSSSCAQSCKRLSLTEYPKPSASRTIDPQLDASEIMESCRTRPIQFAGQWSRERWKDETDSVRQLLERRSKGGDAPDFGEGRLMYHELMKLQREVALPVGATPAEVTSTERTVRAGCLRAHLILTELALVIVHQAKDGDAEGYYRAVQRLLKMESQKVEQALKSDPAKPGRTAARKRQ